MNMVLIMLLTIIHFHVVKSQENPQPPENHHPSPEIVSPIHPSVPVIAGIVCVMFSLTFLLCAFAKFCHNPFTSSRQQSEFRGGVLVASTRPRSSSNGIDKDIIESLPFFRFSSLKGSKEGLECAVCISRFDDSEVLRLLPTCKHAFHVSCIDRWLESHATCPLCRCALDLRSASLTNSLRYGGAEGGSNLSGRVEVFVERAHEDPGPVGPSVSFRKLVNFGSFRKLGKKKNRGEDHRMLLHEFKHKIVVSDAMEKNRWSDLNSSDFLLLSSEMMSASSSERFSVIEQTEKVKEDMDRKRLIELRFGGIVERSDMVSDLGQTGNNYVERRSMSEMTNVSRFSMKSRFKDSFSGQEEEEATRRLVWLPIARRTVRWFAGRERTVGLSEAGPSNV